MEDFNTMNPDSFLRDLLLSEVQSDVRVIVERSNYPAHSFVLKRRSPVIAKMLESDFVEGQTQRIVITDFEAIDIEMFLRYLYTDMLPKNCGGLCKLVRIADKYLVSKLTEKCEESLLRFVDLERVYELCNLADVFNLEKLLEMCLFLIKRAAFMALQCDDLKCFSKNVMESIVSADDLNVKSEIDVFWVLWRWGNLQFRYRGVAFDDENVREVINDLLKHVRWCFTQDDEGLEKIISLGITVDDASFQQKCQPRKPSTMDISWFLDRCNIVNMYEYSSALNTSKQHFNSGSVEVNLISAVSLSELPFYVVGVLLVLFAKNSNVQAKLTCSCESLSSVAKMSQRFEKCFSITDATGTELNQIDYQEVMYEFANPIQVCKNQEFIITITNITPFGSVQMNFSGKAMLSDPGEKVLFVYGNVCAIKKLYLL